jgi:aminoglycoside 3-N-acetyltransferase
MSIKQQLLQNWRSSGIERGDILLLHSRISGTVRTYLKQGIRLTAEDILDSFLNAIGESGTLLVPLFNFGFAKGEPFDIRSTPSQMGALTEAARIHPDSVRTGHPIYSFAIIGKKSDIFKNIDNYSGYGKDSPFGVLHELGGTIAILDLPDQNSMTFYHYVEEMNRVPYRYQKEFTGLYTDFDGNTEIRKYGLYVRNLEQGVKTHVHRMGEILWQEGLYQGNRPGVCTRLRSISSISIFNRVSAVISEGKAKETLYTI